MVDDNHKGLPVSGYRDQPTAAVDLVNQNKEIEERVLRQIEKVASQGSAVDQRMIALAKTQIQQAFMWLNRGIFQPERVKLPEDRKERE